jgi:hypothetical protein
MKDKTKDVIIETNSLFPEHVGKFTFKYPDLATEIAVGNRMVVLNGGRSTDLLPVRTKDVLNSIAWLEAIVIDAPDWFYRPGTKKVIDLLNFKDWYAIDTLMGEFYQWRLLPDGQRSHSEANNGSGTEELVGNSQSPGKDSRVAQT